MPANIERAYTFLHAVELTPLAEFRHVVAISRSPECNQDEPTVLAALAHAYEVAWEHRTVELVQEVKLAAEYISIALVKEARRRPVVLSPHDALLAQFRIEWCAIAFLLVEEMSEESFLVLWRPFAWLVLQRG